jgi:hypothetical protein
VALGEHVDLGTRGGGAGPDEQRDDKSGNEKKGSTERR